MFISRGSILPLILSLILPAGLFALGDLLPSRADLKSDRPRILLRPNPTPYAVSLEDLRSGQRDSDYDSLLARLRGQRRSASAQAMVWLLTGESEAADSAVAIMARYEEPKEYDTFHIHSRLTEFGYAYDWLYDYPGFTMEIKADVRRRVLPTAHRGLRNTNDHIFHNYVWMSGGGAAMWALATAGEDDASDSLYDGIMDRFENNLYPAWEYLDGLPSEPLGYWTYYVFNPGMLNLLACQSASETDILGRIERERGDWVRRHFDNLIQSVLPDLRFIPWGDLQSGPNGGVTIQQAGILDGLTWALYSGRGMHFSRRLAAKRGIERFYGSSMVYYFIYTRNLRLTPEEPPLSFLAGNSEAGHFIARSGWEDGATVVSLGCTDHYGDHHHYDQGGFMIYRNGLLAVDPPVYRKVAGPQQPTAVHNTLLIDGMNQRRCRGQWFASLDRYERNLYHGEKLETGQITFYRDNGDWAAVSCQFGQAYNPDSVKSVARRLLFIRPSTVVVVDHVQPADGVRIGEVQWLIQLPREPEVSDNTVSSSNGISGITCHVVRHAEPGRKPLVEKTEVDTWRAAFSYEDERAKEMIHVIEVYDGQAPGEKRNMLAAVNGEWIRFNLDDRSFEFRRRAPWEVREK